MARVATISSLEAKIEAAEAQTKKYLEGVERNQENIIKWKEQIDNQLNVSVEDLDTEEEKLLKRLERIRAQKERVACEGVTQGEAEVIMGVVKGDIQTVDASEIDSENFED